MLQVMQGRRQYRPECMMLLHTAHRHLTLPLVHKPCGHCGQTTADSDPNVAQNSPVAWKIALSPRQQRRAGQHNARQSAECAYCCSQSSSDREHAQAVAGLMHGKADVISLNLVGRRYCVCSAHACSTMLTTPSQVRQRRFDARPVSHSHVIEILSSFHFAHFNRQPIETKV